MFYTEMHKFDQAKHRMFSKYEKEIRGTGARKLGLALGDKEDILCSLSMLH